MDIQHDWEETVAESTLLPATLFYPEVACLNIQADAAWLPLQQKRQKSWLIKRNMRQSLLNPPVIKNRIKRQLRKLLKLPFVGLAPCKARGKKGASLKRAVPKDYITLSLNLDNISSFCRRSAVVCNC